MKIPVIPLAIVAGQVLFADSQGGSIGDKVGRFVAMYTGFEHWSGRFHLPWLLYGYGPWAGYGLAKRMIFPLAGNPNRALSRMHLPISL